MREGGQLSANFFFFRGGGGIPYEIYQLKKESWLECMYRKKNFREPLFFRSHTFIYIHPYIHIFINAFMQKHFPLLIVSLNAFE